MSLAKYRRAAVAACALAAGWAIVAPARATDLETEIESLVASHPQVQAAREGVSSADAAIGAARSNYYPQAHVTANVGPEHFNNAQLVQSFGAPLTANGYGGGFTVTQHLYDGNATDAAVETAKGTKSISEATLRTTRQTTILEGVAAYLDVLKQGQLVKLARDDEQRLQTQLHLEDDRVQRGAGVAVDVLAAKHRLQIAKERRVNFEGALEQAVDRFTQVFGHAPDALTDKAPEPPASIMPATIEEALKIAQQENPSIEAAQRTVSVSDDKVDSARATYFPSVDAVGKLDFGKNRDSNVGTSRDWSLLLQLNWDLFTGFRTQAQVAQAAHDLAASKDTADQARRKTAESVRLAWSQLQTARERVDILTNAVNLAYNVWDSRKKMRESGKATVIDVLDAETDITNAQISLLTATFDRKTAAYALILGLGRLEPGNLDSAAASGPSPVAK